MLSEVAKNNPEKQTKHGRYQYTRNRNHKRKCEF